MRRRSEQLNMRQAPEDIAAWEAAARAEDLPLAAWIRRTLRAALPRSFAEAATAKPAPGRRLSAAARAAQHYRRGPFKP
jgi:hypothetical protein